jgi:hypothetical protein
VRGSGLQMTAFAQGERWERSRGSRG